MRILSILAAVVACAVPSAAFGFTPLRPVQVCAAVESACSCSRLRSALHAAAHLEMQPSAERPPLTRSCLPGTATQLRRAGASSCVVRMGGFGKPSDAKDSKVISAPRPVLSDPTPLLHKCVYVHTSLLTLLNAPACLTRRP